MNQPQEEPPSAEHWLNVVRDKVAAIRFGSVQITVHDGRVTQVEAVEKTRIAPDRAEPALRPPPKHS
jgi:hypothetical protein